MNWLMSKMIGAYVGVVQRSAKDYGGVCTWDFSQCVNPVASLIAANPVTADGVCEMLSAKWIDAHAHDGALANWIVGSGGKIDPSKIRLMMQLFIVNTTMKPSQMIGRAITAQDKELQYGDVNQDKSTRNYLASRGIIRRGGGLQNGWGVGNKAGGAKIKVKMAEDLCDSRGGNGSYRIIGIYGGDGGGHCMACFTGLQDIAFFDPNFGEFWFEDKKKFKAWFREAFFVKSTYSRLMNNRYELFDYALKVN